MHLPDIIMNFYGNKIKSVLCLLTDADNGQTKLHLVAKLDELDLKLCDHENEYAEVQVKGQ